ncbi:MAG: lipopolysaccharide biosynthesis protein [Minwuia sp.]|uniref:lipopolysaccharide biosynthesis protein n=1 Tax=Minwuia sp. TaxID=2493630 RepID=UPI003A862F36
MIARAARRLPPALRQTLLYALSIATAKAVSFVMVPVFTQFLTPEDYGRLDVLQTLADLLSVVIGLGLADCVYRFAGTENDPARMRRAAASVFGLAMASGAIFLAAGQLAAPWVANLLPGGVQVSETRLILISLAASGLILVPLAWLRLNGRAGTYALASGGRAVLQALLATLLLSLGFGVAGVLLAGMIACIALTTWMVVMQLRQTGLVLQGEDVRRHAAFGGPLVLAGAAAFVLGSCDRWFLAALDGTAAVAAYAVAVKFGLIVAMGAQPFELWWQARRFPMLGGENGPRLVAASAWTGTVWVVLCGVGVAAVAPQLIRTMTPAAYHGAADLVPWLSGIAVLHAVTGLLNVGIYSGRTGWDAFRVEGAVALAALALYGLLIPRFGVEGAISATALAQAGRMILVVGLAQKRRPVPYPLRAIAVLLALGAAALAAIWMQSDWLAELAAGVTAALAITGFALVAAPLPPALAHLLSIRLPFLPGHLLAVDRRG